MADTRQVNIPEDLFEWVEKRLPETDFGSVDKYVSYVVEQVREKITGEDKKPAHSAEDEAKVKERLKALGYLD